MGMHSAERRYARVFMTLTGRWSDTLTFRKLARLGEPHASAQIALENAEFAQSLVSDPEYDQYFVDRHKFVASFGGPAAIGKSLTTKQLETFRRSVDIASIVFMHSTLDAAISELCHVAAEIRPSDWEPFIERQQLPLASVKGTNYDALLQEKLAAHLQSLERSGLLKRADTLFQICKSPPGFSPLKNYAYDRDEVERLDLLRHRLVHAASPRESLHNVEETLEFFLRTGMFFWLMLNHAYSVKLNPIYALGLDAAPNSGVSV